MFTNAWRKEIPYGVSTRVASNSEIWEAAGRIYKDYPSILEVLGLS